MRFRNKAAIAVLTATSHAALLAASPVPAVRFGSDAESKEITAIERQMADELDVDKVVAHYADDAVMVTYTLPGWYDSKKRIHEAIHARLAQLKSLKSRMDEVSVASNGNFACAAMQLHIDTLGKDGVRRSVAVRQIDAFKKIDGEWRIVQQHVSVPVDQKTGQALFDVVVSPRGPLTWTTAGAPGPRVAIDPARDQILAWLTASEIPKDIEEMKGYYGPDQDNIIFDWWSAREARGKQEIEALYGPSFVGVRNLEIKIPEVRIDTDGQFGIEISQQHLRLNMNDGTSNLISFRQSDCVRRVGDRWYSFFEMGSFPVDATGKAIMSDPDRAGFK